MDLAHLWLMTRQNCASGKVSPSASATPSPLMPMQTLVFCACHGEKGTCRLRGCRVRGKAGSCSSHCWALVGCCWTSDCTKKV